tara:strand:- start:1745 stop:2632 length:888 start_codon:yes stop_codon:yes gene_type:complete
MIKFLFNKLFRIEIWHIAISKSNFKKFLNSKGEVLKNHIQIKNPRFSFFADPFIIKVNKKKILIILEEYSFFKGGKISLINYEFRKNKYYLTNLLKGKHYSYPSLNLIGKKNYIFPEMSAHKKNFFYEIKGQKLKNKTEYLNNFNVIDPTLIKIKNSFWLFFGKKGHDENKNLYLYHSKNLKNWNAHKQNPIIKNNDINCRPAGSIISFNKKYFRPAQNCENSYGKELKINLIQKINKLNYKEKLLFTIYPKYIDNNCDGIHHISFKENFIVFDKKTYRYSLFKIFYKMLRLINN